MNTNHLIAFCFMVGIQAINPAYAKISNFDESNLLENALNDDLDAQCSLARDYYLNSKAHKADNDAKLIPLLTLSSERGYDEATFLLGVYYISKKDDQNGLSLIIKSARNLYVEAQIWLARYYKKHHQIPDAIHWYQQSLLLSHEYLPEIIELYQQTYHISVADQYVLYSIAIESSDAGRVFKTQRNQLETQLDCQTLTQARAKIRDAEARKLMLVEVLEKMSK